MYVGKVSSQPPDNRYNKNKEDQAHKVDIDLNTIFAALQGRVRFGSGTSGNRGENIGGVWLKILTSATTNHETGYKHNLQSQPMGYIIVSQDKNGSLCGVPTGDGFNSTWTSGTAYFRSNGTSGNFVVFLLERGGMNG